MGLRMTVPRSLDHDWGRLDVDLLIPRPSSELPGEVVPPTHDRPAAAERADGAIHDRRGDHLFAEPVDTAGGRLVLPRR